MSLKTYEETMMMTTTADAARTQDRPTWRGLVRSELRKCLDTDWARSILLVMGLMTAGMCVAGALLLKNHESWLSAYGQVGAPATTLLGLLLITLVSEEWSRGTGQVSFALVPDRARLLEAKVIVALLLTVVTFVPLVVLTAVVALVAQMVRGVDVSWTTSLLAIPQAGLPLLVNVLLALALALWVKDTTWATVAYFLIPPLTVMLAQVPQLAAAGPWFSLGHSSSVFAAGYMEQTPLQVLVSLLLWVALPFGWGLHRALRDDVA